MLRMRTARRPPDETPSSDEDARRLALELSGLRPPQTVDVMQLGVVLEPGEHAWRDVSIELRHSAGGSWSAAMSGVALVTDRRLLVKLSTGQITSLWWGSLVGFEPCLSSGYIVLDYGDGSPRLLSGRQVATIAVVCVAAL